MNMEKANWIYVLDYSTTAIYEIKLKRGDKHKDIDDILREHGCNIDECSYMIVEEQIDDIIRI